MVWITTNAIIEYKHAANHIFEDVCLRKHKLSEKSYDIAILGHHISATREELTPDLSARGMFPEFWHRENDSVYLWKSDQIQDRYLKSFHNLQCESFSDILKQNHKKSASFCIISRHPESLTLQDKFILRCNKGSPWQWAFNFIAIIYIDVIMEERNGKR